MLKEITATPQKLKFSHEMHIIHRKPTAQLLCPGKLENIKGIVHFELFL
jgi:hypothetical protein